MAEELPLPKLAWDPITECFNNPSRKRVRQSSPSFSSDPAIFSSDDDPSAENYTEQRRKKKYRGPWYHQIPASETGSLDLHEHDQNKTKRTFERKFDSGVFMGSDGTDVCEDEFESTDAQSLPFRQSRASQTVQPLPSPEDLARSQIQRCLEDGDETIDLSSRGLTSLSNATVKPLATFTRVPPVTEGVFTRLEPKLKIFLASNNLTTLPAELFNLDRLTVLSLRGNNIHELPPNIGKLTNLKELNLSQNGLRYLPFEILDLFSETSRLNTLHLHPNIFLEPQFPITQQVPDLEEQCHIETEDQAAAQNCPRVIPSLDQENRSWHPQWKVVYQARTDIRYLNISGMLFKGPRFLEMSSPGPTDNKIPVADPKSRPVPPASPGNRPSYVPSLLEVALQACVRTPQFQFLGSFLPEDSPSSLHQLLDKAVAKKESGGSKCTICRRNFIVPRTEWIEWWEITKVLDKDAMANTSSLSSVGNERDVLESMVPLIRRGCSWLCVPEKVPIPEESNISVDE